MTDALPIRPRLLLGASSVALLASVTLTAASLGPEIGRPVMTISALVAIGFAIQSAAWDSRVLPSALLFSLPPVVSLLGADAPTWLIGPMGALLLVGVELNAVSWLMPAMGPLDPLTRSRLLSIGGIGGLGLAASPAVWWVGSAPVGGGIAGVVVAALALAALAFVMFGRGG
jgi:hypothetical protein